MERGIMSSTDLLKRLVLVAVVLLVVLTTIGTHTTLKAQGPVLIGLITKTETNPFFVKMREGAQAEVDKAGSGYKLLTASGKTDTDNDSQVTAIENMITHSAQSSLLVPANSKAIVPSIKKARDAGVLVIALDTP